MSKYNFEYPRVETMKDDKPVIELLGERTVVILRVKDVPTTEYERTTVRRAQKTILGDMMVAVLEKQSGERERYVLSADEKWFDVFTEVSDFLERDGWRILRQSTKSFKQAPRVVRELILKNNLGKETL
jgi:hypothetical protein